MLAEIHLYSSYLNTICSLECVLHHFTFPFIVAPIYYRGMVLICTPVSGLGLPGVNLIIYKDDLRMMAQNPVIAREGAMKDYGDCCGYYSVE